MGRLRVERICREVAPLVCGDRVLATRCYVASSLMGRLVGLLATPDLARHEALWIESCASVHSVGLRGRIGVAFVDERGRVLRVVDPMPRGRIVGARGARAAIELAAGNLEGVRFGDALALEWERPRPRRHEEEREDGGGVNLRRSNVVFVKRAIGRARSHPRSPCDVPTHRPSRGYRPRRG